MSSLTRYPLPRAPFASQPASQVITPPASAGGGAAGSASLAVAVAAPAAGNVTASGGASLAVTLAPAAAGSVATSSGASLAVTSGAGTAGGTAGAASRPVTVSAVAAGAAGYDSAVLTDTPIVFWNNAAGTDLTGHGHVLTPHASPGTQSLPDGSAAWHFDGAAQYCETPDAADLSPATTGIFTVEAWISPETLTFTNEESDGYVHWAGKGVTGQHEYVNRMYGADNTAIPYRENRISGYAFSSSGGIGNGAFWETPGGETAGTWLHYVFVINSVNTSPTWPSGYVTIYRNGVNTNTQTLAGITLADGTAPLRLGTRDFASWFRGAIGKYAVYNYELPASRVVAHFQAMPGGGLSVSSLTSGHVNTSAGTTAATASVTPAPGSLLVLYAAYAVTGGTTVTGVSGLGLTWARQKTATVSASTKIDAWTAVCGATPGTDAVTVTFGTTAVSADWDLDQVTGQDPVTPLVSANQPTAAGSAVTASSLAYAPAGNTSDLFLFGCALASNQAQAPAESPAWTQLANQQQTSPSVSLETQVSPGGNGTTGSSSWTTSSSYAAIGLELAGAGPRAAPLPVTVSASAAGSVTAAGPGASLAVTVTGSAAGAGATSSAASQAITVTAAAAIISSGSASLAVTATAPAAGNMAASAGGSQPVTVSTSAAGAATGTNNAALAITAAPAAGGNMAASSGTSPGAITVTPAASGNAGTAGAASRPVTAAVSAAGTAATASAASVPVTAAAAAGGSVATSAGTFRPVAVTTAITGTATGGASQPVTATASAAGTRSAAGAPAAAVTLAIAAAGSIAASASASRAVTVTAAAAGGAATASSATLPVTVIPAAGGTSHRRSIPAVSIAAVTERCQSLTSVS